MFPALFVLILAGLPISFGLIATSFVFGWIAFGHSLGLQLFNRVTEITSSFVFAAVPMFILMGALLERSGTAERLFAALHLFLGRLRGGVALAAMLMGGIFAAATGIIGAVEIVIGLMTLPIMLAHRYDKGLISGTITAAGSLGTIIPPSVLCVVYGQIGQLPITDLFAGCLIPGLMMVALFMGYITLRCVLDPAAGPAIQSVLEPGTRSRVLVSGLLPPAILIAAVLGSILAGIASPTEAGAVGALGAIMLAAAHGRLRPTVMLESLRTTMRVTSFIMLIVLGGMMFASIFQVLGGQRLIAAAIELAALPPAGTIAFFLAIVFLLGFVLDWATIVLLTVPIFAPIVRQLGIDPLWFAVLMIVTLQTSYLTPPMAPAIFYLRSIAPPEITYGDMVRGVVPFIICQLLVLALVGLWPPTATWLPGLLGG
jgi:tripartite ATP-independent transporter DctM subunit